MTFLEAFEIVKKVLGETGITISSENYDGIIVKRLEASNTLDEGRTTNQTHIAITGEQMDIFPYLKADGYFREDGGESDSELKKYFVSRIPVVLFKNNCDYLSVNQSEFHFVENRIRTFASVVRSKRASQADQIQMSMINLDGEAFVEFRKALHAGSYLVFLKAARKFEYHIFGVKNSDADQLNPLNNKLYKLPTNTIIDVDDLVIVDDIFVQNKDHIFTIEELGAILKEMYTHAKASGQVAAIHMFGFKYGAVIDKYGYSSKKILDAAGMGDTKYDAEISKGINIYRSVKDNEYGVKFQNNEKRLSYNEEFLKSWNLMIDDVKSNGNQLIITLERTQHTLVWENDRFCDTAYAAPAKQYIDFETVKSVYLGSFIKKENNGTNAVKYNDSKAIIKLLIEKYGLVHQDEGVFAEDILSHNVYGIHITGNNNALSSNDPHICIGWSKMGDLSTCTSKDDIAAIYSETWPDAKAKSKGQDVGQIYRFVVESSIGDYVIFGDGSFAHIGIINSDYYYNGNPIDQDSDYVNNKKVTWLKDVPYTELSRQFKNSLGTAMSFFRLNDYKSVVVELLAGGYESDSIDDEEIKINICNRAPRSIKLNPLNLIIYGAPGTGKTYSTTEYAVATIEGRAVRKNISTEERKTLKEQYQALVKNGQIVFTTFHQNYSYEDFIQGLRPDSKDGVLDFVPVDGVFKQLAYTAMHDQLNNYVIIIDEINRGNISKVFGELITLIEEDKRWGEENQLCVTLPSGEEFAVPNNLYIIGTMNSADKSIALIDTALRRRFEFEEVAPNSELVEDEVLKKVLISLNSILRKQLDSSDLLIGHAYFIGKTAEDLPNILNRNIIPLLYEYFYDQEKKVKDALAKALEGTSVIFDENNQGRIRVK